MAKNNTAFEERREAFALLKGLRSGDRKARVVANLIKGLPIDKALAQLQFCNRRVAVDIRKCLLSAIANAENNHNLDIDNLYVAEAVVNKTIVMKRFHARARGRGARIEKPFCNVLIKLKEFKESN
jgi:large subunit ribosomal protein L22